MKIDILTLFPVEVSNGLGFSIPQRAQRAKLVDIGAHQLRDWASDKHGTVDDSPYGGGAGMVIRVDVTSAALEATDPGHKAWRVMMAPEGDQLDQKLVGKLSRQGHIVLLCGRYEGFDARVDALVDQKISIGPYVLSGGEIAAIALTDTIIRLLPGALGNSESLVGETHSEPKSEFPQYTRPEIFRGAKVPEVLLSGDHAKIASWRESQRMPQAH